MGIFSFLNRKGEKIGDFKSREGLIIDVRTKAEFQQGHIKGSKNIPLNNIAAKVKEIKKMDRPIIFCCASGMRSGQATAMATREGIECMNGGGWSSLKRHWS